MPSGDCFLVDTNIQLRLSKNTDPEYKLIQAALNALNRRGCRFYVSLQNIAEFWNVCTRPIERNGFDLSIEETNRRVAAIERTMTLLPDNEEVYSRWRKLIVAHSVRGVQVHDARLVAVMQSHDVPNILTLNIADFMRFAEVRAVHPRELIA